ETEATHERVSVSSSEQHAERRDSHHRPAKLRSEKKPGALVTQRPAANKYRQNRTHQRRYDTRHNISRVEHNGCTRGNRKRHRPILARTHVETHSAGIAGCWQLSSGPRENPA